MTKKRDTVYMQGKLYWAKIFGSPRPNYNNDGREWTFEFEPDDNGLALLKEHKLTDRLKEREGRNPYIILKRKEFDYEGKPNEHIRVVDAANHRWNDKTLIGNESLADVKVQIVDYGKGKKQGIYPVAIRVLEHVQYESNDFEALDEDDPRVKKANANYTAPDFEKDFGMDEDEPTNEPIEEELENHPDLDDDMPAE